MQDDSFDATDSVTICASTTDETEAPIFRLAVEPNERNGLRSACRLMVDKITTVGILSKSPVWLLPNRHHGIMDVLAWNSVFFFRRRAQLVNWASLNSIPRIYGSRDFPEVIEAGLGAGPQAFRSIAMHTFPSTRSAKEIWSRQVGDSAAPSMENMPAYQKLKQEGMDACGLTQLASRTVGVPFVGLIAGCLVISELLRRLHGGGALEFVSGSVSALGDLETGTLPVGPFAFGHVQVA